MKGRVYIQRRVKPYQANGKTTLNIQGRPGVYLIYEGDRVVYVGYSGKNMYKTMYRHFQKWNDKTQKRVTYRDLRDITIRAVYTNNSYNAARLEKALINKYKPRDNEVKYKEENTERLTEISRAYMDEPVNPIITSAEALPF